MNKAPFWPQLFLDGAQECNHIVVRFLFDLLHALWVITSSANFLDSILGDNALARPSFADEQFNPQPYIGFMRRKPDAGHLLQQISFIHSIKAIHTFFHFSTSL